jgi:hypothetical protein
MTKQKRLDVAAYNKQVMAENKAAATARRNAPKLPREPFVWPLGWFATLTLLVLAVCVLFVIIGAAAPKAVLYQLAKYEPADNANEFQGQDAFGISYFAAALILFIGYWFAVGSLWFIRFVWRLADQAGEQIPSLQEIDAQLRSEGHDPSLQDVLAVEQHLRSHRNEALIGLGALYVGTRAMRGKPLL